MYLLHRIGPRQNSNFNTIQEILAATGPLSFDGIYLDIVPYIDALADAKKEIVLFFAGDHMGRDNSFDKGQPHGVFADFLQLHGLAKLLSAEIGFHSWSHRDLTQLSDKEVREEVAPPWPMKKFAYPYGLVDARVAKIVEQAGYEEAFAAGPHGDGTQFQRKRQYLNWG